MNAIWLADANEPPPSHVELRSLQPAPGARLHVLGTQGSLVWKASGNGVRVELPDAVRRRLAGALAWTLRIPALRT